MKSAMFIAAITVALVIPAADAGAANKYYVTFAARSCPDYASVMANRARNNIQESLKDLGADTVYSAGQAIDPTIEAANQPNCAPITNWQFRLGTGYKPKAVLGPWGALSIITGDYGTNIVTQPSIPLLNSTAGSTGQSLAGAVTVQLTDAQSDRAARPNRLWTQGGTTTDPVLNVPFPGEYGFAALRCSIDNLNGDNVEWISFPTGSTHVFCYAYYVKPPPTSGTIIVRKAVTGSDAYRQTFNFQGNISYESGGKFAISAEPGVPGQSTFYRAQTLPTDEPWTFRELGTPNWTREALTCTSATSDSDTTTDLTSGETRVFLAAGDTVTCTYTNRFDPPPAGLLLLKTTVGGVGAFGFSVKQNGAERGTASATTTAEGVTVAATPELSLPAGSYRIDEDVPTRDDGRWKLQSAYCDGTAISDLENVIVTLTSGTSSSCAFTNRFYPDGRLLIRKTTLGAVGTTGFSIQKYGDTSIELNQSATTAKEGVAVNATGDSTRNLTLGKYVIQETTPTDQREGGWRLTSVVCDGVAYPFDQGRVTVTLTESDPALTCDFVNQFERSGTISPEGGGASTQTNLRVTKSVTPTAVDRGGIATYTVRIRNTGSIVAQNVVLQEQLASGAGIISYSPSRYDCGRRPFPICEIGDIAPGRTVSLRIRVKTRRAGSTLNRVAVGTSTDETTTRDNVSSARLRIRSGPGFTG